MKEGFASFTVCSRVGLFSDLLRQFCRPATINLRTTENDPSFAQAGSDVGHRIVSDNGINGGIPDPMWTRPVDLKFGQVLYLGAGSNNKLGAASALRCRSDI